jgi:transposase
MIASSLSTDGVRVWVATQPVDMRKSFDSLAEVVRTALGHDPLSGSLFVFRNRSAQRVKILWYDRDGLTIYYKRLSRGTFHFPTGDDTVMAIDSAGLLRLLSGMTVVTTRIA